ncbi:MAG: hypothetical protein GDA36_01560 [Rhodobacteraceae bacterium]|nr:hypothetical protein [Paracoccaceae bacterium]
MNAKNHPDPGVVAKDAFRGFRYALKRGAKLVVKAGPRQLSEQFEAASTELLHSAENLAKTIDRIAKHILGLEFDPGTFGPPSFATALDAASSDQNLSRDASNLFFALTLCVKHMQISDLLVSETLCARLIAEDASYDWPPGQQDTATLCSHLYRHILAMRILGDPPGVPSQHNADRIADIRKVAFAASLWTYLERGGFRDSEEDLIIMCCDVTEQKSAQLAALAVAKDGIQDLFDYALAAV